MKSQWQSVGQGLLVVGIVIVLASSGVALAHGGGGAETTTTVTTATSTAHHDTGTATHAGGNSGQTETRHDTKDAHQTASGHGHDGGGEATASGHHESGEQSDGHSHDSEESGLLSGWMSIVGGLFLLGAVTTAPTYRYVQSAKNIALGPLHLAGALLALFTAAVHLYLFFEHGTVIMLLAGLGFVGGVVLLFAGVARRYLYVAGIAYTLAQLALWVDAGMPHLGSFGLLDKVVQVALIGVLGYLYARGNSTTGV